MVSNEVQLHLLRYEVIHYSLYAYVYVCITESCMYVCTISVVTELIENRGIAGDLDTSTYIYHDFVYIYTNLKFSLVV